MRIHHDGHPRQRGRPDFFQKLVHVLGYPVDVIVTIYLAKPGGLNIAPAEVRLGKRHLIHAAASTPGREDEISLCVGNCIAQRQGAVASCGTVRLVDLSAIVYLDVPAG